MRTVIAVLALALAASAAAKGPDRASICGATRCVAVRGDIKVYALVDWMASPFGVVDAPRPAPYYGDQGLARPARIRQLPARLHLGAYWRPLPRSARALYANLVRGLAPRTAPAHWPGAG